LLKFYTLTASSQLVSHQILPIFIFYFLFFSQTLKNLQFDNKLWSSEKTVFFHNINKTTRVFRLGLIFGYWCPNDFGGRVRRPIDFRVLWLDPCRSNQHANRILTQKVLVSKRFWWKGSKANRFQALWLDPCR